MHIGQNRLSCVGQLYFLSLSLPPSRIFLWRSVLRCIGNDGGTCFIQKYIHMSMHMYVHTDVDFRRCILHNWQGLMCITHKSIEILRHFFCTLVFLRHCVCAFRFVFFCLFHYHIFALCRRSRNGAMVTAAATRATLLFGWRKFLEVFCMYVCTCVSVCLRQCVVRLCVCVRVVVGAVSPAVRERRKGEEERWRRR